MMRRVVVRLVVALICLLVGGWLAVSLRDARREQRGVELSRSPAAVRDPAVARKADELLRDAGFLSPDASLTLARSGLALRQGQLDRGIELLRDLVREEPRNLPAWRLLALAAQAAHDGRLKRYALRRARELSPSGAHRQVRAP